MHLFQPAKRPKWAARTLLLTLSACTPGTLCSSAAEASLFRRTVLILRASLRLRLPSRMQIGCISSCFDNLRQAGTCADLRQG